MHKSTFFIELEETEMILREATPKSLVIVDELGRGTSTFDGYAIAKATLNHLLMRTACLSMFTTHYRWLVNDYIDSNGVEISNKKVGLWTM